jgi:uncharacterized protein (DUF1015 family)
VFRPFRAVRPTADGPELAGLLCPPYDVIDPPLRRRLLDGDSRNAVAIILPEGDDPYGAAAQLLDERLADGAYRVDPAPALYVYEMRTPAGHTTRGLLGAVELRDPADGVILPHENTMAGPVADRLALMRSTETDLEPIYLIYDGGGPASKVVDAAGIREPLAQCTTEDGVRHTLWTVTDPGEITAVADDLAQRRAMIADGHHRYATYRTLQAELRAARGDGPWDLGLTLLVDSTEYGPEVHPIHRYVAGLQLDDAAQRASAAGASVADVADAAAGLARIEAEDSFAVVLTDGTRWVTLADRDGAIRALSARPGQLPALTDLDVTVLHRGLFERAWGLADDERTVGYAHSVPEAVEAGRAAGGCAVLVRPTPVAAVAAVAAAGGRMPRKSTLFTPKPASGLVMRRFVDQDRPAE